MDIQIFDPNASVTTYFWAGVYHKKMGDGLLQRLELVTLIEVGKNPLTPEQTTKQAEDVIWARWNEPDDGPFDSWKRVLWQGSFTVHSPPAKKDRPRGDDEV